MILARLEKSFGLCVLGSEDGPLHGGRVAYQMTS